MDRRIQGFDGLRAIAVFLVFLMHKAEFGAAYEVGHYGVWLFFLLSGYLITGQLVAARSRVEAGSSVRFELGDFWLRRSLRIFPPYYVVLIFATVVYIFVKGEQVPGLHWHYLYMTNIYIGHVTQEWIGTWGHFWSLAVEEQFYLLFAPLVLFTPRRFAPALCAALIVLGVGWRLWLVSQGAKDVVIYVDSFVNFATMGLGGLGAIYGHRLTALGHGLIAWASLAVLLAFPYLLMPISPEYMPLLAVAVAFVLVISTANGQHNSLTKLLSVSWIVHFGRTSYGFYLWQSYVPNGLVSKVLKIETWWTELASFLVALVLSSLVTEASWRLLEQPILQWRKRMGEKGAAKATLSGPVPPLR